MASWNFTSDSDIQKELSEYLESKSRTFDKRVSDLYTQVDALAGGWAGDDYVEYSRGVEGYHQGLKDLGEMFRLYGNHFGKMSTSTKELSAELVELIRNMTDKDEIPVYTAPPTPVASTGNGGVTPTDGSWESTLADTDYYSPDNLTYKLNQGDTVSINGSTYEFYGRDDIYNFYKKDGYIYRHENGNMVQLCDEFSWMAPNYAVGVMRYSVEATSDAATAMGLPTVQTRNPNYTPASDISETVCYGKPSTMLGAGVAVYATDELFLAAVSRNESIIRVPGNIDIPWSLVNGEDIKPGADGFVNLVYDSVTKKYYPLDDNGCFERNSVRSWTVSELSDMRVSSDVFG